MRILKGTLIKIISWNLVFSFIFVFIFGDFAYAARYIEKTTGFDNLKPVDVPIEYGQVTDRYNPDNQRSKVIVIHDLHAAYKVQKNIREILAHLHRNYGISAIGLEGVPYGADIDTSLIKTVPDEDIKKEAVDYFVRHGMIKGAEEYVILNKNAPELIGLEEKELYDQDANLLLSSLNRRNLSVEHLHRVKYQLKILEDRVCSGDLKKFRTHYILYRQRELPVLTFHKYLSQWGRQAGVSINSISPDYARYMAITKKEKSIDYKKVEKEYTRLLKAMDMDYDKDSKLRAVYKGFKNFLRNPKAIREKMTRLVFSDDRYVSLRKYIEVARESKQVNAVKLVKEEDLVVNAISSGLCKTEDEETLLFVMDYIQLLVKFLLNQISGDELDRFYTTAEIFEEKFIQLQKKYPGECSVIDSQLLALKPHIEEMGLFYNIARKRDEVFVKNIINELENGRKNIAVVMGGFHTVGVKKLLKEKQIPHVTIAPRVARHSEEVIKTYYALLRGAPSLNYEEILEGQKLALMSFLHVPWFCKRFVLKVVMLMSHRYPGRYRRLVNWAENYLEKKQIKFKFDIETMVTDSGEDILLLDFPDEIMAIGIKNKKFRLIPEKEAAGLRKEAGWASAVKRYNRAKGNIKFDSLLDNVELMAVVCGYNPAGIVENKEGAVIKGLDEEKALGSWLEGIDSNLDFEKEGQGYRIYDRQKEKEQNILKDIWVSLSGDDKGQAKKIVTIEQKSWAEKNPQLADTLIKLRQGEIKELSVSRQTVKRAGKFSIIDWVSRHRALAGISLIVGVPAVVGISAGLLFGASAVVSFGSAVVAGLAGLVSFLFILRRAPLIQPAGDLVGRQQEPEEPAEVAGVPAEQLKEEVITYASLISKAQFYYDTENKKVIYAGNTKYEFSKDNALENTIPVNSPDFDWQNELLELSIELDRLHKIEDLKEQLGLGEQFFTGLINFRNESVRLIRTAARERTKLLESINDVLANAGEQTVNIYIGQQMEGGDMGKAKMIAEGLVRTYTNIKVNIFVLSGKMSPAGFQFDVPEGVKIDFIRTDKAVLKKDERYKQARVHVMIDADVPLPRTDDEKINIYHYPYILGTTNSSVAYSKIPVTNDLKNPFGTIFMSRELLARRRTRDSSWSRTDMQNTRIDWLNNVLADSQKEALTSISGEEWDPEKAIWTFGYFHDTENFMKEIDTLCKAFSSDSVNDMPFVEDGKGRQLVMHLVKSNLHTKKFRPEELAEKGITVIDTKGNILPVPAGKELPVTVILHKTIEHESLKTLLAELNGTLERDENNKFWINFPVFLTGSASLGEAISGCNPYLHDDFDMKPGLKREVLIAALTKILAIGKYKDTEISWKDLRAEAEDMVGHFLMGGEDNPNKYAQLEAWTREAIDNADQLLKFNMADDILIQVARKAQEQPAVIPKASAKTLAGKLNNKKYVLNISDELGKIVDIKGIWSSLTQSEKTEVIEQLEALKEGRQIEFKNIKDTFMEYVEMKDTAGNVKVYTLIDNDAKLVGLAVCGYAVTTGNLDLKLLATAKKEGVRFRGTLLFDTLVNQLRMGTNNKLSWSALFGSEVFYHTYLCENMDYETNHGKYFTAYLDTYGLLTVSQIKKQRKYLARYLAKKGKNMPDKKRVITEAVAKAPAVDRTKATDEQVSGFHAGLLADVVKMLAEALPFGEVVTVYQKFIVNMKDQQMPDLQELIKSIPAYKVYKALLNIYLDKKQKEYIEKPGDKERMEEFERLFNSDEYGGSRKAAGVKRKIRVMIFEGTKLIKGPDKFLLSPFIVKPDGTAEFHISRLLIEALYKLDGKKRAEYMRALVERELTLQKYLRDGLTFDDAHSQILRDTRQLELMDWARRIIIFENYEEKMNQMVKSAVNGVNRVLNNVPYSEMIRPEQVHIVPRLPEGINKSGYGMWTEDGHVYIDDMQIFKVVNEQKSIGSKESAIDIMVLNLIKLMIARNYYVEYSNFRAATEKMSAEVREKADFSRLLDRCSKKADMMSLIPEIPQILNIDFALISLSRSMSSPILIKLANTYSPELFNRFLELFPSLEDEVVPKILPDEEEIHTFLNSSNFEQLKRGVLTFNEFIERVKRAVIPELAREYCFADGYRLLYEPGGLSEVSNSIYPSIRMLGTYVDIILADKDEEKLKPLRADIEQLKKLVNANFAALELIFNNPKSMTRKVAETIIDHFDTMVGAYSNLAVRVGSDEANIVKMMTGPLLSGIKDSLSTLEPGDTLPKKLMPQIIGFNYENEIAKKTTVHEFVNHVHQESLELLDKIVQKLGHEMFSAIDNRRTVIDTNEKSWLNRDRSVSNPLMRSVLCWPESFSTARIILQDNALWAHIKMGDHAVGIYVNPSPPDEGGILRIRYAEGEDNKDPNSRAIRVAFIEHLFENLGMRVKIIGDNEMVQAVLDKDSNIRTGEDILRAFHTVTYALNLTRNMDHNIGFNFADDKETAIGIARKWADIFMAENDLPFRAPNEYNAMPEPRYSKYLSYMEEGKSIWPQLGKVLNAELERLGLPRVPEDMQLGQRVIDKYFNEPVRLGLLRGEYVMSAGRPEVNTEYWSDNNMYSRIFTKSIYECDAECLMTGSVVRQLDGYINFETVGGMGRYLVQRGAVKTASGMLDIYALRDIGTNAIQYATVYEVSMKEGEPVRSPMTPRAVHKALDRELYETGPPLPVTEAHRLLAREKLYAEPYNEILGASVRGLASSSGEGVPVTGAVTYKKDHKKEDGRVFISPFTTPDDINAIKEARSVITTGGGILAHAGITTREFGIPSVILHSARWEGEDEERHIVLNIITPKDYRKTEYGVWMSGEVETSEIHTKEGDIITVDGRSGAVIPVKPELQADIRKAYRLAEKVKQGADVEKLVKLMKSTGNFEVLRFVARQLLGGDIEVSGLPAEIILEAINSNSTLTAEWGKYKEYFMKSYLEEALNLADYCGQSIKACRNHAQINAVISSVKQKIDELIKLGDLLGMPEIPEIAELFRSVSHAEKDAATHAANLKKQSMSDYMGLANRKDELKIGDIAELRRVIRKAEENSIETDELKQKLRELQELKDKQVESDKRYIIPLDELDEDYIKLVGGKNAKLGMLLKAKHEKFKELSRQLEKLGFKLDVPGGFAVTTIAYLSYLEQNGIREKINSISASGLSARKKSGNIKELLHINRMNAGTGLGKTIMEAVRKYGRDTDALWYAVRSSAIQEDTKGAAFAGAGSTFLYVNENSLLEKVQDVEDSVWNERAIIYRQDMDIAPHDIRQSVGVQEMVDSELSGIIFTEDPVSNNPGRVVINASYGQGEAVVSGMVTADQYVMDKSSGEELEEPVIGTKRIKHVRDPEGTGTKTEYMNLKQRRARALSPEQTKALTLVAKELEEFFGEPQDIEFGIKGNTIWILQSRPVTTAVETEKIVSKEVATALPVSMVSMFVRSIILGMGIREWLSGGIIPPAFDMVQPIRQTEEVVYAGMPLAISEMTIGLLIFFVLGGFIIAINYGRRIVDGIRDTITEIKEGLKQDASVDIEPESKPVKKILPEKKPKELKNSIEMISANITEILKDIARERNRVPANAKEVGLKTALADYEKAFEEKAEPFRKLLRILREEFSRIPKEEEIYKTKIENRIKKLQDKFIEFGPIRLQRKIEEAVRDKKRKAKKSSQVSALHAGLLSGLVNMLAKWTVSASIPFSEVFKILKDAGFKDKESAKEIIQALAKGSIRGVREELKKIGLMPVYNALLGIYLREHKVDEKDLKKYEIEGMELLRQIFNADRKLLKSLGITKGVKVILYEGDELIEGPDKFLLSPFIRKGKSAEFHINRKLLKALYAEHGKKEMMMLLASRELALQKYLKDGHTFNSAHSFILKKEGQRKLFNFAKQIVGLDKITSRPQDADAWVKLGIVYANQENNVAAIKAFIMAAILDPQYKPAWGALEVLLADEDEKAASKLAAEYSEYKNPLKELRKTLVEPEVWENLGIDSFINEAEGLKQRLSEGRNYQRQTGKVKNLLEKSAEALTTNDTIGGYTITGVQGAGGMGIVYNAEDGAGKKVAIKMCTADDLSTTAALLREGKVLQRIRDYKNPAKILFPEFHEIGFDEDTHRPFVVMELIEGISLTEFIEERESIESEDQVDDHVKDILRIAVQILKGLQLLHKGGIVYNDLKPDNIILQKSDDGSYIVKLKGMEFSRTKLIDFGAVTEAAKAKSDEKAISIFGTEGYMSPEMILSDKYPGPKSDIFAFGIILFELLNGAHPVNFAKVPLPKDDEARAREVLKITFKMLDKFFKEDSDPPVSDVKKILKTALARKPEDRQSATELINEITKILAELKEEPDAVDRLVFRRRHYYEVLTKTELRTRFGRKANPDGFTAVKDENGRIFLVKEFLRYGAEAGGKHEHKNDYRRELLAYLIGKDRVNTAEIRVISERETKGLSGIGSSKEGYYLTRLVQDYKPGELVHKDAIKARSFQLVYNIFIGKWDHKPDNWAEVAGVPVTFDNDVAFDTKISFDGFLARLMEFTSGWLPKKGYDFDAEEIKTAIEHFKSIKKDIPELVRLSGFSDKETASIIKFLNSRVNNLKQNVEEVVKRLTGDDLNALIIIKGKDLSKKYATEKLQEKEKLSASEFLSWLKSYVGWYVTFNVIKDLFEKTPLKLEEYNEFLRILDLLVESATNEKTKEEYVRARKYFREKLRLAEAATVARDKEPAEVAHIEGLRLKQARAGLWVKREWLAKEQVDILERMEEYKNEIIKRNGVKNVILKTGEIVEVAYDLEGLSGSMKAEVENILYEHIEGLTDAEQGNLLKQIQARERNGRSPVIVVSLLQASSHLLEDHQSNGFIGINQQLFNSNIAPPVRRGLLSIGMGHELSHEIEGKLADKELKEFEEEQLERDLIRAIQLGITADDIVNTGIFVEAAGLVAEIRNLDLAGIRAIIKPMVKNNAAPDIISQLITNAAEIILKDALEEAKAVLKESLGNAKFALFTLGSAGRGELLTDSDIDYFILPLNEASKAAAKLVDNRITRVLMNKGFEAAPYLAILPAVTAENLEDYKRNKLPLKNAMLDMKLLSGDTEVHNKVKEVILNALNNTIHKIQLENELNKMIQSPIEAKKGQRLIQYLVWFARLQYGIKDKMKISDVLNELYAREVIDSRTRDKLKQAYLNFMTLRLYSDLELMNMDPQIDFRREVTAVVQEVQRVMQSLKAEEPELLVAKREEMSQVPVSVIDGIDLKKEILEPVKDKEKDEQELIPSDEKKEIEETLKKRGMKFRVIGDIPIEEMKMWLALSKVLPSEHLNKLGKVKYQSNMEMGFSFLGGIDGITIGPDGDNYGYMFLHELGHNIIKLFNIRNFTAISWRGSFGGSLAFVMTHHLIGAILGAVITPLTGISIFAMPAISVVIYLFATPSGLIPRPVFKRSIYRAIFSPISFILGSLKMYMKFYGRLYPAIGKVVNSIFFIKLNADFVTDYTRLDYEDDFAETYKYYVLHSNEFRERAKASLSLRKKYNWMKENVFKGIEYVTDPEGLPVIMTEEHRRSMAEIQDIFEVINPDARMPSGKVVATFDIHGTLLAPDWEKRYREVFESLTGIVQTREWIYEHIYAHADSDAKFIEEVLKVTDKKYPDEIRELLEQHKDTSLPPAIPGALQFIKGLHEKGIPIIIVSSVDKDLIVKQLKNAGFMEYLDGRLIFGAEREGDVIGEVVIKRFQGSTVVHFDDWTLRREMVKNLKGIFIGIPQGQRGSIEFAENRKRLMNYESDYLLNDWNGWEELLELFPEQKRVSAVSAISGMLKRNLYPGRIRQEIGRAVRAGHADIFEKWEKAIGVNEIEIGAGTSYSANENKLVLNLRAAKKLVELHGVQPEEAGKILRIEAAYAMNKDRDGNLILEDFMEYLSMDEKEIVALPLWFDAFCAGLVNKKEKMRKRIGNRMKIFSPASVRMITDEVFKINKEFSGDKRFAKPSAPGVVDVKEARKLDRRITGLKQLVNVIRGLRNVGSRIFSMPAVLAITANQGDFDSIAAYAIGAERPGSILEVLMRLQDILSGRAKKDRIIHDLNAIARLLGAT